MTDDDLFTGTVRGGREPADAHPGLPRTTVWADETLNRLGLRSGFSRDCSLAVVVALACGMLLWSVLGFARSVEGITLSPTVSTALILLMCGQSLMLCVRRTHPVLCLVTVALAEMATLAVMPTGVAAQGLASFIAAYTCGTLLPPRRLVGLLTPVVLVHGLIGALVAGRLYGPALVPDALSSSLPLSLEGYPLVAGGLLASALAVYVGSALVGAYVGTRRRYAELVRVRTLDAIRTQQERAANAVRNERTRMARELHDIAAHHLSGMVVQAGAAQRLIGRDDRAALEAVAWVRSQGKETLDSLRLVVGALRDPGEEPASTGDGLMHSGDPGSRGAPVPGAAALDRLVQMERGLGAEIEFLREGASYPLPPVADITVYRVAQEALSNAREHAAGADVRLLLRYSESRFVLRVDNENGTDMGNQSENTAGVPRGLGLLGMKERAQLVGATLEAGATTRGGWRVRLSLPVDREISAAGNRNASEGGDT
ncbi:sensor histidine kinase [Nocardiopsis ansamitocini]|uniref:histidine kinase n=1 Tax=Nocardiopsis ansamitocini TaxID=1670832 RepID=A0A9W6PA24_9ACTN|nr:histidine kinase [Nocardiopsis ansamitocini]GLU49794.1 hypothetical protein Nans01_41450 [Nocardiopsis ansamitocini]